LDQIVNDAEASEYFNVTVVEPSNFIPIVKGKAATLYSTLSKGVHWELFVSSLLMDEVTVKDAIRNTYALVADLALVSHFIPTAYRRLNADAAVEMYKEMRKVIA